MKIAHIASRHWINWKDTSRLSNFRSSFAKITLAIFDRSWDFREGRIKINQPLGVFPFIRKKCFLCLTSPTSHATFIIWPDAFVRQTHRPHPIRPAIPPWHIIVQFQYCDVICIPRTAILMHIDQGDRVIVSEMNAESQGVFIILIKCIDCHHEIDR